MTKEISEFVEFIDSELTSSSDLISYIISLLSLPLKLLYPSSTLKIYGSVSQKLALPTSDLDLAILGINCFSNLATHLSVL